jgi:ATP-dependent RNA helicase RhlE
VFNFELPNVPEQYVHRNGRTARAGAEGIAIRFVDGEERGWLKQIERLTRVQLEQVPLPANFEEAAAKLPKPAATPAGEGRDRNDGFRSRNNGAGDGRRRDGNGGGGARADGDQPRRRFNTRKPSGVGAHKGAVSKAR